MRIQVSFYIKYYCFSVFDARAFQIVVPRRFCATCFKITKPIIAGSADDQIDKGFSDANGTFALSGSASDLLPFDDIEPRLSIEHQCNLGKGGVGKCCCFLSTFSKNSINSKKNNSSQACDNKLIVELPQLSRYFKQGTWYEFGTMNLEQRMRIQNACSSSGELWRGFRVFLPD